MRSIVWTAALLLVSCAETSVPQSAAYHLIPGRVPLDWHGPDGNTIVLDAHEGLIIFDTGRSPQHAQAILEHAKSRNKPIAAILNSHWHLDHVAGTEAFADCRIISNKRTLDHLTQRKSAIESGTSSGPPV